MNYKIKEINPILLSQYNAILQLSVNESTNSVKEKFQQFENVENIFEANALFKKLFSEQEGKQIFFIDGVEINICRNEDLFRISADTSDEFILYEFNK